MVARYPLVVHSPNHRGDTLLHHAVHRDDDRLLDVLFKAKLPRFWFRKNDAGRDILDVAASVKSRMCVKLILEKLVESKQEGRLALLPEDNDRFVRSLIRLAPDFHDLVAVFLHEYGLDDAGEKVGKDCTQLQITPGAINVAGLNEREPLHLWLNLAEQNKLKKNQKTGMTTRVHALIVGLPNAAGILPPDCKGTDDNPEDWGVKNSLLHQFLACGNAQLFGNEIMRAVLQFKWESYARNLFLRELALFVVYLLLFCVFTICLVTLDEDEYLSSSSSVAITTTVLAAILPCFAIRLLNRFVRKIMRAKSLEVHLKDMWGLGEVISSLLMILVSILYMCGSPRTRAVCSILAFGMWLQILYFLRAFEFAGGLIRMVFSIFAYTAPFLLILVIVVFGAANSFFLLFSDVQRVSDAPNTYQSNDPFYNTIFVTFYLLILGEMELTVEELDRTRDVVLVKILFSAFALGVTVFMLNLMINLSA